MNQFSSAERIKVLVADRHPVALEGVASLLKASGLITVCGFAHSAEELVEKSRRLSPAVILLSLGMPYSAEEHAVRDVLAAGYQARILCLGSDLHERHVLQLIRSGVSGYVSKRICGEDLVEATLAVAEGRTYFAREALDLIIGSARHSPSVTGIASPLTELEHQIVTLVCENASVDDIAFELAMSPRTVESAKLRIMRKMKVSNVAGLVTHAVRKKYVDLDTLGTYHAPPSKKAG